MEKVGGCEIRELDESVRRSLVSMREDFDLAMEKGGKDIPQAPIMFQDVVTVEIIKVQDGRVGISRHGRESEVEEFRSKRLVDVEIRLEGAAQLAFGNVLAVVVEEAMVCLGQLERNPPHLARRQAALREYSA